MGYQRMYTTLSSSKYLIVCCTLAGCAIEGAPVGWGGSHKVVLANEHAVTYQYDALVGGYGAVMAAATEHCASFGKSPVPTVNQDMGIVSSQTFECR